MTWTPFSAGCFVLQPMTCTIHAAQCIMASAAPSLTLWMRRPGARPLVLCQKKKKPWALSSKKDDVLAGGCTHGGRSAPRVDESYNYVEDGRMHTVLASWKSLYALKRLTGHISTVLVCFVLFFCTCLTRITNKTQVLPRCANNESCSRWFGTKFSFHSLWSVLICLLCMEGFGLTSSQHWNANMEAGVYSFWLPHFLRALCNDSIMKSRLIRRKISTTRNF